MPDDPTTTHSAASDPMAPPAPTAAGDGPGTASPPEEAPRPVRRRRASKAAAAPSPAEPVPPSTADTTQASGDADAAAAPRGSATAPTDLTSASDESAPPAPVKRTRKAAGTAATPRKRASRAAKVDTTIEPAGEQPGVVEQPPAVDAAALDDVSTLPATVEVHAGPGDADGDTDEHAAPDADAVTPDGVDAVTPTAPAPRSRRKRLPAAVTFQAPVEDGPAALEPTTPEPAGVTAEPEEGAPAAPRRRRRAGTAGVVAPAAFLAPTEQPSPPEPDVAADQDVDAASVPADADAGPAAEDDEDPDRPRRRRRGRRGRGRRPEGEDEGSDDLESEGGSAPSRAATARAGTTPDATTATAPDGTQAAAAEDGGALPGPDDEEQADAPPAGTRRRRRRRRSTGASDGDTEAATDTVVHVREPRAPRPARGTTAADEDGVRGITGSTRMAAKRSRRQEGRDSGRRRPPVLTESEFLARREAVDRAMVVRQQGDRTQIAVLEDGILVEHYVTKASAQSYAGNVYLGKVQNVLPSMEAAFMDIGKGRNGVLYAGEVNYDAQLAGQPRKIEQVLKSGQEVLVQVTKDPINHKGARLTSQVSLPGRYLVYVPEGSMTGISRKLPENERARLKAILKKVVPDDAGVIIRTAAEGIGEDEIARDVRRLQAQWEVIRTKAAKGGAPVLLHAEPDLLIRVVRDVFNEDFTSLVVQGESEWDTIREYVEFVAPDLAPRLSKHAGSGDVFAEHRIDEQLQKALDRKVWLPSGGSLVIDRTEAMVVVDVNTGKYVGKGGNLEETVTRNNLEAAEEIARQLRLRDLGGIIVVDFIDMVLESNRDLVVRRLVECLGRDRTKHQVAEVTSLGLVQMTRKRVGQGLLESFSETCEHCGGRGLVVHSEPVDAKPDRGERFDERDRAPRGRGARTAEPAAAGKAAASAGPSKRATADSGEEDPGDTGPKRRRRGGRGAGSAQPAEPAVDPAVELAELLAPTGDPVAIAAAVHAASRAAGARSAAGGDVQEPRGTQGDTDAGGENGTAATTLPRDADGHRAEGVLQDALPELGDQAAVGGQDQPDERPEPGDRPVAAAQDLPDVLSDQSVAAGQDQTDVLGDPGAAPAGQDLPVPAEPGPAEQQPALADEPAAPRRRRRATSRPAGPPVAAE